MDIEQLLVKKTEEMPTILEVYETDEVLDSWIKYVSKNNKTELHIQFLLEVINSYSDKYAAVNKDRSLRILEYLNTAGWEKNREMCENALTILVSLHHTLLPDIQSLMLQKSEVAPSFIIKSLINDELDEIK